MLGFRTFAAISRNYTGHETTNIDSVRAAATTGPRTGPLTGPLTGPEAISGAARRSRSTHRQPFPLEITMAY